MLTTLATFRFQRRAVGPMLLSPTSERTEREMPLDEAMKKGILYG
jgi:hypothetical protein